MVMSAGLTRPMVSSEIVLAMICSRLIPAGAYPVIPKRDASRTAPSRRADMNMIMPSSITPIMVITRRGATKANSIALTPRRQPAKRRRIPPLVFVLVMSVADIASTPFLPRPAATTRSPEA